MDGEEGGRETSCGLAWERRALKANQVRQRGGTVGDFHNPGRQSQRDLWALWVWGWGGGGWVAPGWRPWH